MLFQWTVLIPFPLMHPGGSVSAFSLRAGLRDQGLYQVQMGVSSGEAAAEQKPSQEVEGA